MCIPRLRRNSSAINGNSNFFYEQGHDTSYATRSRRSCSVRRRARTSPFSGLGTSLGTEVGALTVPMIFILAISFSFAMGALGLQYHWRKLVERQLRLDRCVGRAALALRDSLNVTESSIRRMKIIRTSLAAAVILPEVKVALEAALQFEAAFQKAKQLQWKAHRLKWLTIGCGAPHEIRMPLPVQPWQEEPPDVIGPRPLRWTERPNHVFSIQIHSSPRSTKVLVRKSNEDRSWHGQWPGSP